MKNPNGFPLIISHVFTLRRTEQIKSKRGDVKYPYLYQHDCCQHFCLQNKIKRIESATKDAKVILELQQIAYQR
jgi:hypothetical protein